MEVKSCTLLFLAHIDEMELNIIISWSSISLFAYDFICIRDDVTNIQALYFIILINLQA
jgi:hypothetical protein